MRDPNELATEAWATDPGLNEAPDEDTVNNYLQLREDQEEGEKRKWPETPSEILRRYLEAIHNIPDTLIPAGTIVRILEEASTAAEHAEVNLFGHLDHMVFESFFDLSSEGYWKDRETELEDMMFAIDQIGAQGLLVLMPPTKECPTCKGLVSADVVAAEKKIHDLVEAVAQLRHENQQLLRRAIAAEIEAGMRSAGYKE